MLRTVALGFDGEKLSRKYQLAGQRNRAAKVLTDHQIIRRPDCGVRALGQRSFSQHHERSLRTRRPIVHLACRRSVPDLEVARRSARLHSLREKIQWPW